MPAVKRPVRPMPLFMPQTHARQMPALLSSSQATAHGPLLRLALACLGVALGVLSGCARVNDLGMRAVSTKVDAYVVVQGELLAGQVLLVPDRTGRAMFEGGMGSIKSCMGGMRYTASNNGVMDLRCDNGMDFQLQTTHLSETRGFGYGTAASTVFGLDGQEAASYLRPPAGKRLVQDFKTGLLELQP